MTETRKAYLIGYHLGRVGRFYDAALDRLNLRDPAVGDAYHAGRAAADRDLLAAS